MALGMAFSSRLGWSWPFGGRPRPVGQQVLLDAWTKGKTIGTMVEVCSYNKLPLAIDEKSCIENALPRKAGYFTTAGSFTRNSTTTVRHERRP